MCTVGSLLVRTGLDPCVAICIESGHDSEVVDLWHMGVYQGTFWLGVTPGLLRLTFLA